MLEVFPGGEKGSSQTQDTREVSYYGMRDVHTNRQKNYDPFLLAIRRFISVKSRSGREEGKLSHPRHERGKLLLEETWEHKIWTLNSAEKSVPCFFLLYDVLSASDLVRGGNNA